MNSWGQLFDIDLKDRVYGEIRYQKTICGLKHSLMDRLVLLTDSVLPA
jgi:hypothetical protein